MRLVGAVVLLLATGAYFWWLTGRGGACADALRRADGADAGACTTSVLVLDVGLIALYGAALVLTCSVGASALYTGRLRTTVKGAAGGVAVAALADITENALLFVSAGTSGASTTLTVAQGFALLKWVAITPALLLSVVVVGTVVARRPWRSAVAAPDLDVRASGHGQYRTDASTWRRAYFVPGDDEDRSQGVGVCLSGGGIRSGTFALGALQLLAERDVLSKATYLATVSGGGYTGGAHQMLRGRSRATGSPVGLNDAFSAGSPEESHVRRHGRYIADGAAEWARALLTIVRNVVLNLALIYAALFVIARPLGWLIVRTRPWSDPLLPVDGPARCVPEVADAFPCAWAWPTLPVATWLAVATPLGIALVAWVLAGWFAPSSKGPEPFRFRHGLSRIAAVSAAIGIATMLVVLGIPLLTRASQWLVVRGTGPSWPGVAALVGFVTSGATIMNMLTGGKSGEADPRSSWVRKLTSGAGFASRAALSAVVVGGLVALALVAFGDILVNSIADYEAAPGAWLPADLWWLGTALALLLLAFVFDQTQLSLHPFYKRRLASAFAVERIPPDGAEQINFATATTLSTYGRPGEGEPTLIVCAAANVSGSDLAPPGRRVVPFTFTHDYIGGPALGYVRTKDLEGALADTPYASDITLLAAMAISGAAFASAMGRMSGPLNALLSLINARLGAWLPNPKYLSSRQDPAIGPDAGGPWLEPWRPVVPRVRRLTYLVKEIFGAYSADDRLVYVTDGGHYENLGLLELLRRKCRTVYCVDASGDSSIAQTLAQAATLAFEELGVTIEIDGVPLAARSADTGTEPNSDLRNLEKRLASKAVIVGKVRYPPQAEVSFDEGELIVGKAVLTADLPYPLKAHAVRALKFPSESTADQWFDADQFDAYHMLGREVGRRMVLAGRDDSGSASEKVTGGGVPVVTSARQGNGAAPAVGAARDVRAAPEVGAASEVGAAPVSRWSLLDLLRRFLRRGVRLRFPRPTPAGRGAAAGTIRT